MSHASPLEIVERFENSVVHAWADGELVCSRRNEVFVIRDLARPRPVVVARIPWTPMQRVLGQRWIDRALKNSILQVQKAPWGFLVSTGHAWWCIEAGRVSRLEPFSDTRPMNRGLCESATGSVYVADYSLNPQRRAVRIFRSRDGRCFETAWEFPAGAVRHVHALVRDPEAANRIWVLSGDLDPECGIRFTDDDFRNLHDFARSGQECRATDLVVRDGQLYWGMDAPDETAFVLRASKTGTESPTRLFELPGPAYYMTQNEAGGIYVGTTVEPGRAVRDRRAHAFRFTPEGQAQELFAYAKDWVPQYGILYFPKGVLPGNFLAWAQRAVKPHEGCLTIARDRFQS